MQSCKLFTQTDSPKKVISAMLDALQDLSSEDFLPVILQKALKILDDVIEAGRYSKDDKKPLFLLKEAIEDIQKRFTCPLSETVSENLIAVTSHCEKEKQTYVYYYDKASLALWRQHYPNIDPTSCKPILKQEDVTGMVFIELLKDAIKEFHEQRCEQQLLKCPIF